jgi:hypothetical protein
VEKGEVVRVKPGVKDVDFGTDLSGWQGRVVDVHADTVEIAWDSHTLRQEMPSEMITACEEQGLDWGVYYLPPHELEPAQPRDTQDDVQQAVAELARQHAWDWLEEEGEITRQVLKGLDPRNERELFGAWEEYLTAHLELPFRAEVDEVQERGPLQAGDRVRVRSIIDTNVFYGVIVKVRHGRRQYAFPLCDLEALDETSENHRIIQNYRVWFANR